MPIATITTVYNIEISASCRCYSVVVVVVVVAVVVVVEANLKHFILNAKSIERADSRCSGVRGPVLNEAVSKTLACHSVQLTVKNNEITT